MRTHTKTRRLAIAGLMVFPMIAAACGNDDTTGSSSDTTMSDSPETTMGDSMSGEPFGPACSSVPEDGAGSFAGMSSAPAATAASNNPVLSTLVEAVTAADLVDTLNGPGPFTIFAPSNDAFAKIPAADLQAVLADKDMLTDVLTYHVVEGEMTAADLAEAGTVTSIQGGDLSIGGSSDAPTVNDAAVICGDIKVANATVHIIDTVMMPGAMGEGSGASMESFGPACSAVPADGEGSFSGMSDDPAATAASNNPVLSTLVSAVTAAGLGDTLNGPGPFTIFAPSNDAFAKIPADTLNAVLADTEQLTSILTYHVVEGKMSAADLASAGTVTTIQGDDLTIGGTAEAPMVNDAAVICGNVQTANATVHIIDTVLMPMG